MLEIVVWLVAVAVSVVALILSASARAVDVHTAIACIVALAFAAYAVMDNRRLHEAGASAHRIAASTARYMGIVWSWGALGLFATYLPALQILLWKEWLTFTLVFAAVAVLCLFFAATLASDEAKGSDDQTLLRLAHYLSVGQLAGTAIAVVGLIIDGKFPPVVKASPLWQDWAANTMFFFGSAALFIITANALSTARKRQSA